MRLFVMNTKKVIKIIKNSLFKQIILYLKENIGKKLFLKKISKIDIFSDG